MTDPVNPFPRRHFASDNYAGICPAGWHALEQANTGHARPYGEDPWTERACDAIRELFETDCEVFFVFNGTAANALALATLGESYHSVICHRTAHIETDECGAPEFFSNGTKLLLADGEQGRIDPDSVTEIVTRRHDIHYPKPRVLSLTQATELGTVYDRERLEALGERARRHDLRLHMDGARFANAVAALDVAPREITWEIGVDVLCLGGTKNGLSVGEAVVFFEPALATDFAYRCKQAGQLASKMRLISAPWIGLLEAGVWLANARRANACTARLAEGLASVPGVVLQHTPEANAVFVTMPEALADGLRTRGWRFYDFIGGAYRFMCAWDTEDADIDALVTDFREIAATLA
ncbi:MAG: low specificity L-threonine aldolase [Gammaproteobacteria bacterium]|nr:low specificity L-threonine aldolase [Gammaproteobacteria bacterium]